jgi:hypothetical protein
MIKDLLKKYVYARDFIDRAEWQIEELETKKESRQVARYGLDTPGGSSEGPDDKIININAKISMLKKNIKTNQEIVDEVHFGLEGLSSVESDITISIYGYRQRWSKLDELKEKYNYSRSSLYEIANASLEHMARRIFGDA